MTDETAAESNVRPEVPALAVEATKEGVSDLVDRHVPPRPHPRRSLATDLALIVGVLVVAISWVLLLTGA